MAAQRLTDEMLAWIAARACRPGAAARIMPLRQSDPRTADTFLSLAHVLRSPLQSSVLGDPPHRP
jgi:hypothetical protein